MNKIAWEKWYDFELEEEENEEIEEDSETYEDSEDQIINLDNLIIEQKKINTPLGEFYPHDRMIPTRMFDCWIGHTNFPITKKEFYILNKAPGVESLRIMSKYRFFIGIGKMFDFTAVRNYIQQMLCDNEKIDIMPENGEEKDIIKISNTINEIKVDNRWAMFISDEGSIKYIKLKDSNSEEEYQNKLEELKIMKNGYLMTYERS